MQNCRTKTKVENQNYRTGAVTYKRKGLVKQSGLDEDTGDSVWVNVGCGSSVLEVTVTLSSHVSGNTDGSTSVSNTSRESSH